MPEDTNVNRPLFGGAITSTFPLRFVDVSDIRQVPDHQTDVPDNGSATWFLQDLANEQDAAEGPMVIEQSGVLEANGLNVGNVPIVVSTVVGQMGISKGRQGREAENVVKVYLANIRLKGVGTDVLITAYEPLLINPLSESAANVGAGVAVPAAQSGCLPMAEIFKVAVTSFKVNDWNLFGAAP